MAHSFGSFIFNPISFNTTLIIIIYLITLKAFPKRILKENGKVVLIS